MLLSLGVLDTFVLGLLTFLTSFGFGDCCEIVSQIVAACTSDASGPWVAVGH